VHNLLRMLPAPQHAPSAEPALLPRGVILSLPLTRLFFSDVNNFKETGVNALATGEPIFSRQVIYNNAVNYNLRVTYAVDVYATEEDAHAAFMEAVEKSLATETFNPLPDPKIGEESFAGTSSGEGGQLHVGVGARIGNVVYAATRAGFDTDQSTIDRIVFLTRLQGWKAAVLVPIYNFFGLLRS
jgi:hypothetical protein